MSKNLKLSFIFNFAIACVLVAFKSVSAFFGLGIAFVAVLVLFSAVLILICTDKLVKTRSLDLFIISAVFTALEFLVFFVLEINSQSITSGAVKGFNGFQSVISAFAVIYFVYVVFRVITELRGNKFTFIEKLLTKSPKQREPKKAKELTNGSLMEKPNKNKEKELTEQEDLQLQQKDFNEQTTSKNDRENEQKAPVENLKKFNNEAQNVSSIAQTEVVIKSNFNDEHIEN